MATTTQGRRLTGLHGAVQLRLGLDTVRNLDQLWRLLSDRVLSEDEWVEAVLVVLGRAHGMSAALARRYYQAYRVAETGVAVLFDGFPQVTFRSNLARAALFQQLATLRRLRDLGVEDAVLKVGRQVQREMVEEVFHGGRRQVIDTVRDDPVALGWYRVTDGDPCAFCALLASRGAVYKTQQSASFGAHPSCGCSAEPAFTLDKFRDDRSREWNDLYRTATRGHRDKLNAFRRAYERPHINA